MSAAREKRDEQGEGFVVHRDTPCWGKTGANYSLLSGVRGGGAYACGFFMTALKLKILIRLTIIKAICLCCPRFLSPAFFMLSLDSVSFRSGDRVLLDAVSFSLAPGQFYGVIGHNGAGKSTLIRLLAASCCRLRRGVARWRGGT